MNRIIETYAELKIEETLSETWVRTVWMDKGFATYFSFPFEFEVFLEEIAIDDLLNDFYEALKNWFRLSGSSFKEVIVSYTNADSGFSQECEMNWQTLLSEGVDCKPVICILGTLILRFLDDSSNSAFFIDALVAARLYLFLMAIPGSHICQVFHSTLYSHVMSIMRMCCEQIDGHSSPKNKGIKRKKGDGENDFETEDNEPHKLAHGDKLRLMSLISDILSNLKLVIENKKLKFDDSSLNFTVQILLMVARLEKGCSSLLANNLNNFRKDSVSYLAFKSFGILQNIAGSLHTNPNESAKLMIKSMAPVFLINEWRTLGLNPKDAPIVRANFTYFLKLLIEMLRETAYEAVTILIQRICVSVPDRAEMRMKASDIVVGVLKISPPDLLAEEIYSIAFMSHMSESKIRMFTLEIISKLLLDTGTNISFSRLPQKYAAITNDEFLLAIIFYHCQDVSTSVRTKALSYLDQFISCASTNQRARKIVDKIFVDPYVSADDPETVAAYSKEIFDTQQFLLEERFLDDRSLDPLPGVKVVLDMLVYFSQEDKVFIKKCALQTLARLMLYTERWIKKELLQVFLIGCDDSSILVRKTMGQIITDLLCTYQDNEDVIHCWVEGVVPMIAEEEVKAQEKVIEHFSKIILANIMAFEHTTSTVSRLPWLVMKQILATDKRSYLHFAAGKWVQNNAIKNRSIQMIYSHIDTDNNSVVWCLLVSFSQFMDLPNSNLLFEHYKRALKNLDSVPHSQLILETLYFVSPSMSKEIKRELLQELETHLTSGRFPLKLISRSRDICELILNNLAPNKKNCHSFLIEWSVPRIKICIDYISSVIGENASSEIDNIEKLIKFIFLLGELAQGAPNCVTKNDIQMLENLLLSPRKREANAWKGKASNALKAVTILTLVKLVLQKEESANSIMPIFKEILSSNSVDSTIQVNTIIGMCDLCSRYTTLVERYFTYICKCFNSKHENVRMTALMSVMKRVKEEYVKLRPFILFPMLTMILDASVSIKRTIATFIGVDLKKKNNILETFYTGLFYFLNNCKTHSTTVKIPEDLRVMFSLTDRPEDREHIYVYILDKLADPHKRLLVCKKIVTDIMMSVIDESLKLDEKTENILADAFNLLIDNEKKISEAITRSKKGNIEEAEEIEEVNETNREPKKSQSGQAITINENVRLNEANEIIPVLVKLRLLLKKHKSKCMNNLMAYMCELMKNFKNEMVELLQGDAELKIEIEYTLRRLEIEEEERKHAESQEIAESQEQRMEDENRNIQVLTTSPQELCEQLSLFIQLTRCDAPPNQVALSANLQPVVRLTRSDENMIAVLPATNSKDNNSSSSPSVVEQIDYHEEEEEAVTDEDRQCIEEVKSVQGNNRKASLVSITTAKLVDTESNVGPKCEVENEDSDQQSASEYEQAQPEVVLLSRPRSRQHKFSFKKRGLLLNDERRCLPRSATSENVNEELYHRSASQPTHSDKGTPKKNRRQLKSESPRTIPEVELESNAVCRTNDQTSDEHKLNDAKSYEKNESPVVSCELKKSKAYSEKQKKASSQIIKFTKKSETSSPSRSISRSRDMSSDNDSGKEEIEMAGDENCESEWIANNIEIDDDPIEEGQEMFSSDED